MLTDGVTRLISLNLGTTNISKRACEEMLLVNELIWLMGFSRTEMMELQTNRRLDLVHKW